MGQHLHQLPVVSTFGVVLTCRAHSAAAPLTDEIDVVDEAIDFFRANVLFKSFEIKGGADRVLVYLTLFIQQVSLAECCEAE